MLRFRKPKSLWGWTVVISLAMAVLVVVVNEIAVFLLAWRIESRVAAFRARGVPTTFAEIPGPSIPQERNAAIPFAVAAKKADLIAAAYVGRWGLAALGAMATERSAIALEAMVEASAGYEQSLQLADARAEHRIETPLAEPDAPDVDALSEQIRNLSRVETMRIIAHRLRDRPEDAVRLALRSIRLADRCVFHLPFETSFRPGIILRTSALGSLNLILREYRLSPETYATIESHLADESMLDGAALRALSTQRILDLRMYEFAPHEVLQSWTLRLLEQANRLRCLDASMRLETVIGRPYSALRAVELEIEKSRSPLAEWLTPKSARAVPRLVEMLHVFHMHRGWLRCLRVINAAACRGTEFSALAELGLPETATTDPFIGEPLKFVRKPEGLVVYSVGPDLKDDGGDVSTPNRMDIGFGPDTKQPMPAGATKRRIPGL